jgi:membrane protein implicated in regulation of membrane protease activity
MDHAMTPDWRKPVGMLAILGLIAIWSIVIMSLSGVVGQWHWTLQFAFYLVAGIIWITPLKPLLRWMETGRWRA